MSFKIDLGKTIKTGFEGPSSNYQTTKNRFNQILEEKLGVTKTNNYSMTQPVEALNGELRMPSGATGADIDLKLKGTAMEGLGRSFVEAEKKYGVNALFLTSLAIHESAYGSSKIAKDKNNLFGFAAYDGSPYSSARTFATREQGIDHVASYLSENYLTEGGKYYGGATVEGVGKRYATDPNWANAIRQIMDKLMQK
ncbi:MAG TPA: endo-beta-N-acetylglucosaminidase [Clostridiales bacterium UBA8960]|nr:endo-beta-N-acetylglucosaminidase [Clostridiales bacterium UBA8960]